MIMSRKIINPKPHPPACFSISNHLEINSANEHGQQTNQKQNHRARLIHSPILPEGAAGKQSQNPNSKLLLKCKNRFNKIKLAETKLEKNILCLYQPNTYIIRRSLCNHQNTRTLQEPNAPLLCSFRPIHQQNDRRKAKKSNSKQALNQYLTTTQPPQHHPLKTPVLPKNQN
jgi:hypothetical protein